MLIAGLFTADDKIGIQYKLPYSIDQIQIRFRLFIVINDHLLVIEANDKIIYQNSFAHVNDMAGQYMVQYADQTKQPLRSYVQLFALDASNANNLIIPIDTGLKEVVEQQFTISFRVKTQNNKEEYKHFWGFSDVIVIQRRCETCVSE